jgi:hypothetical protein
MKFRLSHDEHQWILEKHIEGGGLVNKGKYKGQEQKPRWKQIGYNTQAKHALNHVFDLLLKAQLESPTELKDIEKILAAIKVVENKIDNLVLAKEMVFEV